jgi:hypothetical protein
MMGRRLLAGILLLLTVAASPAWAEAPPPVSAPPDNVATDNVPFVDSVSNYIAPGLPDNSWVDRTHDYLSRETLETVQWFDDFFGDKTREPVAPAESSVRWRNNFRLGTDKAFTYRTDLRVNLRLTQLSRKLRLVFSSEEFEDALGINREGPTNAGVTAGGTFRQSSTELRYEFLKSERAQADIGTGVQVKLPFVFYTRARYQYTLPVTDNSVFRFFPTLFWRTHDGLGESAALDFEYRFTPATFFRWGNSETVTQELHGMQWNSEPGILHLLGPGKAFTFAVGLNGITHPEDAIASWYVLARYRQAVLRNWIFVEFEPSQSWQRGDTGGYHPVTAAMFRFEILIRGSRD